MEHWLKMGQEHSLTLSNNLCEKKKRYYPVFILRCLFKSEYLENSLR